jgi:hypothetical protein
MLIMMRNHKKIALATMQEILELSRRLRGPGSHEVFEEALSELILEAQKELDPPSTPTQ